MPFGCYENTPADEVKHTNKRVITTKPCGKYDWKLANK